MNELPGAILAVVVGYLLGAVPFGLLVSRLAAGRDLRESGSGRTGATNALRTLGPAAGAVVLVLDVAKGAVAVLLARWIAGEAGEWVAAAAGLAAVIGHIWPVFIGFRGGRGVATTGGALLALLPTAVPLPAVILVAVTLVWRYVSLGSISAAVAMPLTVSALMALGAARPPQLAFAVAAGALVVAAHSDNISRLRAGTERRLGRPGAGS